jgi:hypothetical protein
MESYVTNTFNLAGTPDPHIDVFSPVSAESEFRILIINSAKLTFYPSSIISIMKLNSQEIITSSSTKGRTGNSSLFEPTVILPRHRTPRQTNQPLETASLHVSHCPETAAMASMDHGDTANSPHLISPAAASSFHIPQSNN